MIKAYLRSYVNYYIGFEPNFRRYFFFSYFMKYLTPPLFIDVPVPSQESERSCVCVLGVSIVLLSMNFLFDSWKCSDSVIFSAFHFNHYVII